MKLLRYNARFGTDNDTFDSWTRVNDVIMQNMTLDIRERWNKGGYEGLAEHALGYFGINDIYRDSDHVVIFEFTEQQWCWFILRWGV